MYKKNAFTVVVNPRKKGRKKLNILNTTNAVDGYFADLKNKFRNYNRLSINRKNY